MPIGGPDLFFQNHTKQVIRNKPVGSILHDLCFSQWQTVMWKCKPNKVFSPQVAFDPLSPKTANQPKQLSKYISSHLPKGGEGHYVQGIIFSFFNVTDLFFITMFPCHVKICHNTPDVIENFKKDHKTQSRNCKQTASTV